MERRLKAINGAPVDTRYGVINIDGITTEVNTKIGMRYELNTYNWPAYTWGIEMFESSRVCRNYNSISY